MLKATKRNTRTRFEICSKLTIKTPEFLINVFIVFIVNFEHISHLVLVFLLLTSFFEDLIAGWEDLLNEK